MTSRIVAFLGLADNTHPSFYRLAGTEEPSAARATRLPWNVWFNIVRCAGGDTDRTPIVVVGSKRTRDTWLERVLMTDLDLAGHPDPYHAPVAFLHYDETGLLPGDGQGGFWSFFESLRAVLAGEPLSPESIDGLEIVQGDGDELRTPASTVIVDITHGYRSIPFLGGAVLNFVQMADRRRELRHHILYGAYEVYEEADDPSCDSVPVWDLSTFLDATALGHALDGFDRHGRADDLADFFERSPVDAARALAEPMRAFADDLLLVRLPNLLRKSAPELRRQLAARLPALADAFPPVKHRLGRFEQKVERLVPGGDPVEPVSAEGVGAVSVLAQRLLKTGRYVELQCLLRESLLTLFSVLAVVKDGRLLQPGEEGFEDQRRSFEKHSKALAIRKDKTKAKAPPAGVRAATPEMEEVADWAGELSDDRNDVAHCSMRTAPNTTAELRARLRANLERFLQVSARLL